MTKEQAHEYYSDGLSFESVHKDVHRIKWLPGDWTDDTDQGILILDTFLSNGGVFDEKEFAKRLIYWFDHGFPELGDFGGLGVGRTVHSVMTSEKFISGDPHGAARDYWLEMGMQMAANGAVMRSFCTGIFSFDDIETVIKQSVSACKVTHADPRCIASCVTMATAIAFLLQGLPVSIAVEKSTKLGYDHLSCGCDDPEWIQEAQDDFKKYVMDDVTLDILDLSAPSSIGYTLKCIGAGMYALRRVGHGESCIDVLTQLVMEAGDADTNCAVAGALIGAAVGVSHLPHEYIDKMPHINWLEEKIGRLMHLIQPYLSHETGIYGKSYQLLREKIWHL